MRNKRKGTRKRLSVCTFLFINGVDVFVLCAEYRTSFSFRSWRMARRDEISAKYKIHSCACYIGDRIVLSRARASSPKNVRRPIVLIDYCNNNFRRLDLAGKLSVLRFNRSERFALRAYLSHE